MVDSLLDKAQLDSSEVNLRRQAVEVRRLIEEVVAMFAPFAGEKALAFSASVSLDTPKMILGDELRLRQILVNLISNAIKYTDDGGVSVAISWENGELIVVVEDTGIGIPEQDQAKIFEAFHRVSNDTDVRGAGLGLSIVAQLVTRMQGTIACESTSGQGSRFEFRAPARKLSSDADRADGAKPRIIVVEDDQDLLSLMRIHLGRLPVDLYCASNGRDAVKLGKKLKPDLMILDMRLPILDGYEVAQQMTALSPETILVGLSGNHQQSAIDKAMLAGCSIYLSKPVRMPELIEAVNSVLVLD
jgi:CheY-like chemotaxis protein